MKTVGRLFLFVTAAILPAFWACSPTPGQDDAETGGTPTAQAATQGEDLWEALLEIAIVEE